MPADTARKRYSVMNIGQPWRGVNLTPGVIDQGTRQVMVFLYAGVLTPTIVSFLAAYFSTNILLGAD